MAKTRVQEGLEIVSAIVPALLARIVLAAESVAVGERRSRAVVRGKRAGSSHSGDRGSRWFGGFSVHIARDETCGLGIRQLIGHESESLVDGASWTRGSFNRVSSLGT